MPTRARARYVDGRFELLEPLNLPDGCQVTLEVALESSEYDSGGSWLIDLVDELQRKHPPETREPLPTDGAMNYKHYLYGHPKEQD